MDDWFKTELATALCVAQQALMDELLPCLFGYHVVHLGETQAIACLDASRVSHKVIVSPCKPFTMSQDLSWLPAEPDALPIRSDSVDVVVLSYCLEFANKPHEVLREVYRVLIPEGHLIITGFNPWSLWGIRRLFHFSSYAPWNGKFISLARLNDWLQLLGFDRRSVRSAFFRPPFQRSIVLARLQSLESWGVKYWPLGGAIYTVLAQKKVARLTPIQPRWRPKRCLLPTIVEPSTRSMSGE